MADTLFRCRRCSMTARPASRPLAMSVPPPAVSRSVAAEASLLPSASMRRRRHCLSELWWKETMLTRSAGSACSMTKRTASCSRRIFSPIMEPLTSKTQTTSMGWRRAASCDTASAALMVTRPKTFCVLQHGRAEYSTRVLRVMVPELAEATSGSGCASHAATAPETASSSSSAKPPWCGCGWCGLVGTPAESLGIGGAGGWRALPGWHTVLGWLPAPLRLALRCVCWSTWVRLLCAGGEPAPVPGRPAALGC
mmetsp:Transcript_58402/g.170805  ORF Transcript_58402/g.170805 Transcript_58402/m.170805 type:complete len:253 (-) Transcript_58402:202-960(-)